MLIDAPRYDYDKNDRKGNENEKIKVTEKNANQIAAMINSMEF